MEQYVEALTREIELVQAEELLQPATIFIGGGTPTCLPLPLLERLLLAVRPLAGTALQEYTIEANPGTLTLEKLQLMKAMGVTRISIGVQSDREEQLRLLGRIHGYAEAEQSVALARQAGFANINLDLMYGLPGQTATQWEQTLRHGLELKPEHISLYQLNIEEGTLLGQQLKNGQLAVFDDEEAWTMYRLAQQLTHQAGYEQYEISNYAQPGFASMHNQVYWRLDNYLAFGLGACSFVAPRRWHNVDQMAVYLQMLAQGVLPRQEGEALSHEEFMSETVFMALRMNCGLADAAFQQRFGLTVTEAFPVAVAKCQTEGWLEYTQGYWRLTEQGRVLGNLVFMEFV